MRQAASELCIRSNVALDEILLQKKGCTTVKMSLPMAPGGAGGGPKRLKIIVSGKDKRRGRAGPGPKRLKMRARLRHLFSLLLLFYPFTSYSFMPYTHYKMSVTITPSHRNVRICTNLSASRVAACTSEEGDKVARLERVSKRHAAMLTNQKQT